MERRARSTRNGPGVTIGTSVAHVEVTGAVTLESDRSSTSQRTREGLLAARIADTLWGFLPSYFKLVETVPATEVVAHRVLWAVAFGLPFVRLRRRQKSRGPTRPVQPTRHG